MPRASPPRRRLRLPAAGPGPLRRGVGQALALPPPQGRARGAGRWVLGAGRLPQPAAARPSQEGACARWEQGCHRGAGLGAACRGPGSPEVPPGACRRAHGSAPGAGPPGCTGDAGCCDPDRAQGRSRPDHVARSPPLPGQGRPWAAAASRNPPVITPSASPAKQQLGARGAQPTPQRRHPAAAPAAHTSPARAVPGRCSGGGVPRPGVAPPPRPGTVPAGLGAALPALPAAQGRAERGRAPRQRGRAPGQGGGLRPQQRSRQEPGCARPPRGAAGRLGGSGHTGLRPVQVSGRWHGIAPLARQHQRPRAGKPPARLPQAGPTPERGRHAAGGPAGTGSLACQPPPCHPGRGHSGAQPQASVPRGEGGREGGGTCCQPSACPLLPIKEGNGASPPGPGVPGAKGGR